MALCGSLASAQDKFHPKYLNKKDDPLTRDAKTLTQNGWIELKEETSVAPDQFFERYGASLGLTLNPKLTLQRIKSEADTKGVDHQRFQVYYDNIVVEGMEYSLHSRDNKVQWARGRIVSEIEINIKEVLSEQEALQAALKELGIEAQRYEKEKPQNQLVIAQASFNDYSLDNYKLTYKFLLTSTKPFDIFHAYVDAKTGRVLRKITTIQNCFAPHALDPSPLLTSEIHSNDCKDAHAHTLVASTFIPNKARYLQGQANRTFETEFVPNSTNQQLAWRNFTAGRFDLQVKEYINNNFILNSNTPAQQDQIFDNMPLVINPNTTWQANHQEATTTHWAMEQTQNYFQGIHQRNGPANNGRIGRVITNVPFDAFGNIFIGPARFTQYGNVPGWEMIMVQSFAGQSWSALDIIAHEYAHGFTQYTNNLVYAGESGALNEGISDIIGYCVERRTFPNDWNWALGEDANGTSFRDMQDPLSRQQPDTYQGTNWQNTADLNNDNGGVHTNSGVLNHFFYLLVAGGTKNGFTVDGIGFEKAEAIVYDAFANRIQSQDDYADARLATLASAQSMYGNCTSEHFQVGMAWAAVGVDYFLDCQSNCTYTVTASASSNSVACGSTVNLTANCVGSGCNGMEYTWSGSNINPTDGQSISVTAPTTPGTHFYFVTPKNKPGCGFTLSSTTVTTNCGLPLPNGCYSIKAKHSDKFMQPENGNNGARVRQYSGNGQNNQIFELESVDGDAYKIKAWGTNRVWEAAGAGTGYQTAIQQWDYTGGAHQKWLVSSWGNGTYRLAPKHAPTLIADVEAVSTSDGAGLHLWGQHAGDNQRFYVSSVGCPSGGGGCTPPNPPSLAANPSTINSGQSSTLSASGCSGTVTWSNGLGTGSTKTVNPGSTTTYTATCTVNGCTSPSASVTVNVSSEPPSNNCLNLSDLCSGNSQEIRNYTMPISSGGNKTVTFTYRSHEGSGTLLFVLNGTLHTIALPQTTLSYATITLPGTYSFNTSNSIALSSGGGYLCFREICVSSSGGCQPPNPPSVSANPSTINSGQSSTLSASGCSGTVTWSNGLGTGSTKTVNPGSTTTYTATCTVNGCTSPSASVTVNVSSEPPSNNCLNLSDLCSGNSQEIRNYTMPISSGGNKTVSFTYRSHEGPGTLRFVLNGSLHTIALPQTTLSYATITLPGTYSFNTSNTIALSSGGGYLCFREICVSSSGGRIGVAEDLPASSPELTVSPNPNDGAFETLFYIEPGRKAMLRVSDVQGREVWQKSLTGAGEHHEAIQLPAQSVGSYILILQKEANASTSKVEYKRVIVVK